MSKQITIKPGGFFEQVEIEQSDDVFWVNNDTQPHWPVPWCYGLRVDPNKTSNMFQTFPKNMPNLLPQRIEYQDALNPGQTGVILVYDTFDLVTRPGVFTSPAGKSASIQLTKGGKSPYDTSKSTKVPSWVAFAEATPDSSKGFNAVLTNPPKGSFTFSLNATDALGKNMQEQITINVT